VTSEYTDLAIAYDVLNENDAVFISKARQDIPNLLSHISTIHVYIRHLNRQVEDDEVTKRGYFDDNKMLQQRIAELERKLEASRKGERMWRDLRLEASARIAELQSQGIHGFSERDEFDELMEAMNDDEE
jgi:hypothetical protein